MTSYRKPLPEQPLSPTRLVLTVGAVAVTTIVVIAGAMVVVLTIARSVLWALGVSR